jgi:hypothetical protein
VDGADCAADNFGNPVSGDLLDNILKQALLQMFDMCTGLGWS